jgi:hypothetical protein
LSCACNKRDERVALHDGSFAVGACRRGGRALRILLEKAVRPGDRRCRGEAIASTDAQRNYGSLAVTAMPSILLIITSW